MIDHPDLGAHLLQLAALQARDFELLKENLARGRLQNAEDQAQDGALAAAALAHDDQAIERLDFQGNAVEHFFFRKCELHIAQLDHMMAGARSREKDDVNDIKKRVETDHDGDRGDDARSGRGADASRAALHCEPAVAGDRADEQPKHEALQRCP